jgi:hypothetical protein
MAESQIVALITYRKNIRHCSGTEDFNACESSFLSFEKKQLAGASNG